MHFSPFPYRILRRDHAELNLNHISGTFPSLHCVLCMYSNPMLKSADGKWIHSPHMCLILSYIPSRCHAMHCCTTPSEPRISCTWGVWCALCAVYRWSARRVACYGHCGAWQVTEEAILVVFHILFLWIFLTFVGSFEVWNVVFVFRQQTNLHLGLDTPESQGGDGKWML